MAWIVLIISGVLEAVWATALGESENLTRFWPSVIFFLTLALSMTGLARATRSITTGTAYAVWVGIGAALTVGYAMITGAETASPVKIIFLVGIVGCTIGLKLVERHPQAERTPIEEQAGEQTRRIGEQ